MDVAETSATYRSFKATLKKVSEMLGDMPVLFKEDANYRHPGR